MLLLLFLTSLSHILMYYILFMILKIDQTENVKIAHKTNYEIPYLVLAQKNVAGSLYFHVKVHTT